ncbi:fatty acyl-AMP ligase [Aegicerativicinus sediminis]|uniref:fatty acyl-AMP ligase n=1 Tax=Aegicerativicinus sediminis TaxID=2893202 RepID=UPI001E2A9DE5|nr:fatty acyl-AMP ligase [Aegicerativicinus sediminis]
MIDSKKSLVDVLLFRAQKQPDKIIYRFLVDGESEEELLTFKSLAQLSKSIGARLQRVAHFGARVLILVPNGIDFITSFFGTICAGAVPVPLSPPHHARIEKTLTIALRILKDCNPEVVVLHKKLYEAIHSKPYLKRQFNGVKFILLNEDKKDLSLEWKNPNILVDHLAFLQYTSGSTSAPKGVMVSHGNVLNNLRAIEKEMELNETIESVFWLPPFHDMGLIGGMLQPLYTGFTVTLIPHLLFLQKPIRWLWAISKFKAYISGAPNFAYELCLKKIKPEERDKLDLSDWKVAMNGAEPISVNTLEEFEAYFNSVGFQGSSFVPCYGLAEGTLMVAAVSSHQSYAFKKLIKTGISANKIEPAADNGPDSTEIVSCGKVIDNHQLLIVNPETENLSESNEVGEIWLKGPCVTKGYWNNPEATEHLFHGFLTDTREGPFLRTGDLGFLENEELYVVGRRKNIMIFEGKNFYPHDIERVVQEAHYAIQPMGCAAFSIEDNQRERLIVVVEVRHNTNFSMENLFKSIRSSINEEFSLSVDDIRIVPRGFIARTTSGKIKHYECKNKYITNYQKEVTAS